MSVASPSVNFSGIIALLPDGASLRLDDVSWQDYEQLLDELGDSYAARIFYDEGRMEIMAPTSIHEKNKGVLHTLVAVLRDELDVDIESLGSTTFKLEILNKGAEPDDCFYIRNASLIIGKEDLDLQNDPPPDLVLEVDRSSASLNKFPIYAGLGVPEIWRVYKRTVQIYALEDDAYKESSVSCAFPFLSVEIISEFLAQGIAEGERKAAKAFRVWLRQHLPKTS